MRQRGVEHEFDGVKPILKDALTAPGVGPPRTNA